MELGKKVTQLNSRIIAVDSLSMAEFPVWTNFANNQSSQQTRKDDNIKQVWTIEGRIFCIEMDQGREVKRVVDSPEDLFKVGWSEQRVAEMGVYSN